MGVRRHPRLTFLKNPSIMPLGIFLFLYSMRASFMVLGSHSLKAHVNFLFDQFFRVIRDIFYQ